MGKNLQIHQTSQPNKAGPSLCFINVSDYRMNQNNIAAGDPRAILFSVFYIWENNMKIQRSFFCFLFLFLISFSSLHADEFPLYDVIELSALFKLEAQFLDMNDQNGFTGVLSGPMLGEATSFLWVDGNQNLRAEEEEMEYIPSSFNKTPVDMNDLNQVVLSVSPNSGYVFTGLLWENGEVKSLPFYPSQINNHGVIAGTDIIIRGSRARDYHALVQWLEILFSIPPVVKTPNNELYWENYSAALNESNWVVGWSSFGETDTYMEPKPYHHAFLWKDLNQDKQSEPEELLDIHPVKGERAYSEAVAINEKGLVVCNGWAPYTFQDRNDNLQIDAEEISILPVLNTLSTTQAIDVNDSGVICGLQYESAESKRTAVIWIDNKVLNLNNVTSPSSNVHLVEARRINNKGWILCAGESYLKYYLLVPRQSNVVGWEGED